MSNSNAKRSELPREEQQPPVRCDVAGGYPLQMDDYNPDCALNGQHCHAGCHQCGVIPLGELARPG